MGLNDFLSEKEVLEDNYDKFIKLKEKLINEGLPENLATYKALNLLTPDKLEKIKIFVDNSEGLRLGVEFFFDSEEELKLLGKYFPFNPHTKQIKEAKLLIELLKLLEKINEK